MTTYKYATPHEWLDAAVADGRVSVVELLSFIHNFADADAIQDNFQAVMEQDGYFEELDEDDENDRRED